MTALKSTIDAMKDALNYIDTFGPEQDGEWTGKEYAYETYINLKSSIEKEEGRTVRNTSASRCRAFRKKYGMV